MSGPATLKAGLGVEGRLAVGFMEPVAVPRLTRDAEVAGVAPSRHERP